ncbi:MAG: LPXTG cell wall anchor domain-containing protein, partial [Clostridia bacterium]|nr:LPXTG cell wall anchor domain-containing protein [Clostridia bacterium]
QSTNIYWDELTEVEFENILKKWRADVFKLDAELAGVSDGGDGEMPEELMPMALSLDSDSTVEQLGSPYGDTQGDATLGGAVYGVYKGAELIDTYTTDENGYFITKYYPCGDDWTIREITPSEGYLLDPTVYYMDASAEFYSIELNTIYPDVYEEIIKGDIAIIKHTDDGSTKIETPETGAKFAIFLKAAGSYDNAKETERDIIICDENGFGQTKMLPYGVYTVRQVSGWEGRELMGDFEVYISQHKTTYRYLINNANFESYVRVVKVDAETDKTIPYAGAAFKIYDPDGELVTMTYTYPTPTTIDTFYTDANGSLVTPEKLEYGKGYYLVEVEAPFGYVLDSTPVYFDVTEDNSETEDSGVTVIKVNKANMAQKGMITVTKTGEVFSGVSVGGNEDTVIYQPVYEDANLAGAVFEIRAAEDIITLDGTIRYTKGEVVDTITTGANGTATSKEIYLGKYEVQEITAPHGYVLNGDIHTVELIYAGQNVSVTETATSFYNERQKATLSMLKVLETNDLFDIGSNGEIANVVFGLYAAEELVSASGTAIPADGLIEVINFDENGLATIKTDLPLGSYYVKEIATDEHYILNSDKYAFAFEYAGQEIVSVALTVNGGEAIENDLIYGSVSGKKVTEYGDALTGAVIGLFKQDETEFTADTALMTTVSAEDGGFAFENIPYGNWLVREIEQPVGFVLNDTVYDVVIRENEQVVEIEITNEFIMGDITLTKVDADYPDNKLSGATFEVYKDNNADGVIDDGDELIGTLAEKEPGVYEMLDLYYGHYLVKETAAPEGFLLDEGEYSVFIDTDEKVYVIENEAGVGFIDQPIKGNIALTKIDAEYPDNKLTGATFEVYADNNANGVLDDGDTLIGSLTESEAGVYEMTDLRYGHYLIKETAAPDGFFLDEGVYPVFIETDGTYYVENEAGVGFINEAMKGSLKIVKTSDDGKVAGFSFRITGPDGFDVTLKTDENGEILIEGLRIGEYTVSEVEDEMTEGYILPEDKVATVTVNETVTVEMHNELEPEIPDNPQTGDNSRLGLWLGLAAASLGALIVLVFGAKKKRTMTK